MSVYLSLIEILFIHESQIKNFGGGSGLRDPGQLEAALYRPQSGYYKDVIEEAAALWESLSQNHPFIDGNKRTAFVSAFVFLNINGLELSVSNAAAEEFVLNLYNSGQFKYELIEPWLRLNLKHK